ncbi:MgtC/SapB family protein [Halalkalibacter alkaliphilus]|uniref:MgtC/SapB family protein n=1 Tax=Halalkalibacter alkaliphilus TaxID=2917993 RepID=A0A9X2A708_9BACI|nr:MgtC/SapB family protein [Halalkalibacter alkaliphilus]MCL7746851.1 MgtC/SapB family protein [Halalkalibacter alkaliphilus]
MILLIDWLSLYVTPYLEMFVKVTLSGLLGFIIGWDRTSKSKPAGIKTYMFVSTACCLITLISIHSVEKFSSMSPNTMMDPMRLAAQIVSGLGFLGAGVILKDGLNVKGLTSAAMILFVGGVGIGIGAGLYSLTIFTVLITAMLAKVGNYVEDHKFFTEQKTKGFFDD